MYSSKLVWRKSCMLLLGFFVFVSIFLGSFAGLGTGTANAAVASDFKASVMAPLTKITDWTAFKNQLQTLKSNGVYALTTDVWWGDVEAAGDNQFDWSYYKTYADAVSVSGLKWVPILSTHTCGGNVGDDCNIPIPSWLWSKGTADEMKYKSETGFVNNEALSPFWSGIGQQYNELYASFASNFASYKALIPKIYLSAGPSGELRYPSYYPTAGWSYPSRGKFQVYTDTAKSAFRTAMVTKYGSLSGVNSAWGLSLSDVSLINPPSDGDSFYSTGGYTTTYGKDFLTWNQSVLENHLSVIATAAHNNFDSVFGVHIGAKVSGLHWQYNNPTAPHSAENAAGYYDYNTLIQKFKDNNLDLTFTALEMYDSGTSPNYSMPSTLVDQISSIANSKGVRLNGENALATSDFTQIENKITQWSYNGFTLLRLANLVNSDGSATSNMATFKTRVISHSQSDPGNTVTVYYKQGYTTPYIHYRPVGGTWTTSPGVAIPAAEVSGYNKITIDVGTATGLEAVFNNGSGTWDNNGGNNYVFPLGTSTYSAGTITSGAPASVVVDTTAPSVPSGVSVTASTDKTVSLSWTASTDTVGVTGYEIWRGSVKAGTSTSTTFTDSGLTASTGYTYTVKAYDAAGNVSAASTAVSVTTSATPASNTVTVYYKQGYTTPYIHYRPVGGTWTTSPGVAIPASEFTGYNKITIDVGTATGLEAVFNNGSGTWDNNGGNNYVFPLGTSTYSAGTITSGAPVVENTAPSVPSGVSVTASTDKTVSLSWTASTDNVGVTGYEIWRGSVKAGTSTSTTFTDSGLTASTGYTYTVKAYDAAGNVSAASTAVSVTTSATPASNTVTVYYKQGYTTPYIHYRPVGGTWTTSPGVAMPVSEVSGYNKITIDVGTATGLEAVFNNGSGTWDSNGGNNYVFPLGTSTYSAGTITSGAPVLGSVTLHVTVPSNTPASSTLYLSGTINSWSPADANYALVKQSDGTYSLTLNLASGTTFQYKITRGTWSNVEVSSTGSDIANRSYTTSGGADNVTITVARWKDL